MFRTLLDGKYCWRRFKQYDRSRAWKEMEVECLARLMSLMRMMVGIIQLSIDIDELVIKEKNGDDLDLNLRRPVGIYAYIHIDCAVG
jgi:hypothetical protein